MERIVRFGNRDGDTDSRQDQVLFRDYEPRALAELARIRDLAERIRERFDAEVDADELLKDVQFLAAAYRPLEETLPNGVVGGNLGRHVYFLEHYLKQGQPGKCRDDIDDICRTDLPKLEKALRARTTDAEPYDAEFAEKIGPLLRDQHLDSAVRKAFVILKERLVRSFDLPPELDGVDLVNAVFGKRGCLAGHVPDPERQATRDLLAGMYGVFRNRYGHQDVEPEWVEVAAVLGMVNWALGAVGGYASMPAATSTS